MVLVGDPEQLPCTVLSGVCQKKVDKSLLLPFFCAFLKRICLASVNDPLVFQSYSPLWFCDPSFLVIPTNRLLLRLFLFYILLEATHSCSQLVIDLWHILILFFSWFVSGASAKHSISIIWIRMGWASILKNVLKPDENVITFLLLVITLSSPNVLREQRRSYLQDPCLKDFTDSSDIIKKVSSPIGFRIIFFYNLWFACGLK